jgi:ELWxxDGT repeat protein
MAKSRPGSGPGNSLQTARDLGLNASTRGKFTAKDKVDFWKLTFAPGSTYNFGVNVTKIPKGANLRLDLLNANGSAIVTSNRPRNLNETITRSNSGSGTFYLKVSRLGGRPSYAYSLSIATQGIPTPTPIPTPIPTPPGPTPTPTPIPVPVPVDQGNNTFAGATPISFGSAPAYTEQSISNAVGDLDTTDFFAITIPDLNNSGIPGVIGPGTLNLQLNETTANAADFQLLDSSGQTVIAPSSPVSPTVKTISRQLSADDVGKTFYVQVLSTAAGTNTDYTLNYSIQPADTVVNDFTPANPLNPTITTPPQPRQVLPDTNEFVGGSGIGQPDPADVFTFTLPASQSSFFVGINLTNNSSGGDANIQLYRQGDPNPISSSARVGTAAEQIGGTLSAGTYYIQVTPANPNVGSPYSLNLFAETTTDIPSITKNIGIGASPAEAANLTNLNGTLYFSAINDDGSTSRALWKSTGGSAGGTLDQTTKIQGFNSLSDFVADPTTNTLYFIGSDNAGQSGLWKSDGTSAQFLTPASGIQNLTVAGGRLFFLAPPPGGTDTQIALWSSDGTASGTAVVPGAGTTPEQLVNLNGTLYYVAKDPTVDDPANPTNKGVELWRINVGSNGQLTPQLLDLDTDINGFGVAASSNPQNLTAVGNTLFLTAIVTGRTDREVQQFIPNPADTTGTGGTVKTFDPDGDIDSTSLLGQPVQFAFDSNTVYFAATAAPTIANPLLELYKIDLKSDPSLETLTAVRTAGDPIAVNPTQLALVGGKLYFFANTPTNSQRELWVTSGDSPSTVQLTDIAPSNTVTIDESSDRIIGVGNKVYFTASGTNPNSAQPTGRELWVSDGTQVGTKLQSDIRPGVDPNNPSIGLSSDPGDLTNVNGRLFFTADDGLDGQEVWSIG